MIYLAKKINQLSAADFSLLSVYLQAGKILVLPTDTIYGLSCLAANRAAIRKIFRIKRRETGKPLIVLVSSLKMASEYAFISPQKRDQLKYIWSGRRPTTVILPAKPIIPKELVSESGGVSFRLPKSPFLIKMIRNAGQPLVSTSLNVSGADPQTKIELANQVFTGRFRPDLVLDSGPARTLRPSRLLDLRGQKLEIIRK